MFEPLVGLSVEWMPAKPPVSTRTWARLVFLGIDGWAWWPWHLLGVPGSSRAGFHATEMMEVPRNAGLGAGR